MIREMPVNAVARIMRISDDVPWGILHHFVLLAMDRVDMNSVRRIGIDETSCRKGHDYITLFVDMDSHKVLFATDGKGSDMVKEFIIWFKEHKGRPDLITDVSCDMSAAFLSGIAGELPNAKVTLDRFHIMKLATEAVDKVRKTINGVKKLELKNRFWLLKRNSRLKGHEKEQLDIVLKENVDLGRAYMIKEMLGDMYLLDRREDGELYLDRWISFSSAGVPDPVKHLSKTVKTHRDGILQWFDSHLSNGVLEGINSVIQGVKRMARGYRLPRNMITMIYLRGSGISV